MMGRLTDKVAIITGGASGMGREMVDLFTKKEHKSLLPISMKKL